ncbi:SDR family oxidoreductase [Curtobacterium sp. ISL-83]|uniref:SDR family oxidoreductase n=1 Tax=Curtobacterium sp. ISL-83 TaxID=2819145 RepID=UPI001BE996CB|nr:SDR family NAD(P)-dependent oxidoreductase [Curtobacterium sp. ISL-83]MBT2501708.1 SDR family NAD(P)-dependent oxidoreductase [Curtobacterium sp. ISL-83]
MTLGTAIVVGVGPGLGLALARTFHDAGHPVAILGRNEERLGGFASTLAGGEPVRAYAVDVADRESLRTTIEQAVTDLGAPEVLLYNAAVLRTDSPTDGDDAGWVHSFEVNVLGAKVAAESVLSALQGPGSLLFTGGGLGTAPSPQYASLSVGKAGLRAYVHTLAAEQAEKGVHATVVSIGGVIDGGEDRLSSSVLAQAYLELHRQDTSDWTPELVRD